MKNLLENSRGLLWLGFQRQTVDARERTRDVVGAVLGLLLTGGLSWWAWGADSVIRRWRLVRCSRLVLRCHAQRALPASCSTSSTVMRRPSTCSNPAATSSCSRREKCSGVKLS